MQQDYTVHYNQEIYKLIEKAYMQCGKQLPSSGWKLKEGESHSQERKTNTKPHIVPKERSNSQEDMMK
jgi:hypothetical protein